MTDRQLLIYQWTTLLEVSQLSQINMASIPHPHLSELGASSDAVITMPPNGHDVHRVVLGNERDGRNGLLGSMKKGTILIDMSSSRLQRTLYCTG